MDYFTRAAHRCGALAWCGRGAVLIATAGLIALVTGCGGTGSPGATPAPGSTRHSASGQPGNGLFSPADEAPAVGRKSATSGGALFGGNAALASQEGNLGRRLAIIRVYYH